QKSRVRKTKSSPHGKQTWHLEMFQWRLMTRIIDYLSDAVCPQSLSCSTPKRVRLLQKSTSPVIPTTFSTITNAAAYTRSVARVRSTSSSRLIRIPMQPQAVPNEQLQL